MSAAPPSEKAKMLAGALYDASDPELTRDRARARDLVRRYNATTEGQAAERRGLLERLFGIR